MLRACLGMLVVLGGLFAGYYWWLSHQFDPPGVWIGAAVMALVAGCSLGALINSGSAYREWSLLSAARHDLPWQDGRWTAVSGMIHPVGEALIAPFSGEECVLCEYDVASQHRLANSQRDSDNTGSDYTGFLMNPCVVRTNQGEIKLLGFPNLNGFGERTLSSLSAVRNARTFLLSAEFEDYSGLKMVNVVSAIKSAWDDADGLVRKNVRLTSKPPSELFTLAIDEQISQLPAAEQVAVSDEGMADEDDPDDIDEDELDDDDFDDDSLEEGEDEELGSLPPAVPLLKERRVKVGDTVCAIGVYDGRQRGLVPGGLGADRFVKLVRGNLAGVEKGARSSTFGRLIGGLVGLILVHAVAYGVTMANRYHPDEAKRRQRSAFEAAAQDDVPKLARLVARGTGVNDRNEQGETLLSVTRKPAAVRWLIANDADLNALSNGRTRLMDAARDGDAEIAKLLIDAKADLNLRSTSDDLPAIGYARAHHRAEVEALLRAAGARD